MKSGISTVIYPTQDLAAAKKLFGELLGVEPYLDQPYYVGFRVDGREIGLDPHGHAETGPVAYYEVSDMTEAVKTAIAAGAAELKPAADVGGGKLIATVKDTTGNVIGLVQPARAS